MELTFLGTGTSQGVPIIGCLCPVCTSSDGRDSRLRTSAMVEVDGVRIIIDAGPDFRYQLLREGVRVVDAILLTHEHKDHIGGLDDVRALNFVDYPTIRPINLYGTERTLRCVEKDYDYAFREVKYRGVPEIVLHTIDKQSAFSVGGVEIVPINGGHSPLFESTGFRIGRLAYLTDFKSIEEAEVEKLMGVEVLVVNALRWEPHPSHFSVEEALALIEQIAPERAYLTHMSHDVGLHEEFEKRLPKGVFGAHDKLKIRL